MERAPRKEVIVMMGTTMLVSRMKKLKMKTNVLGAGFKSQDSSVAAVDEPDQTKILSWFFRYNTAIAHAVDGMTGNQLATI